MDGAYDTLPDGIRAVYAPGAACGDSQGFARALVDRLRAGGATVLEGQPVTRLLLRNGRVIGAESAAGRLHADAVILAAGVGTRNLALAAPEFGHRYSLSRATRQPSLSPTVAGLRGSEVCSRAGMWRSPAWATDFACRRAPRSVAPITT